MCLPTLPSWFSMFSFSDCKKSRVYMVHWLRVSGYSQFGFESELYHHLVTFLWTSHLRSLSRISFKCKMRVITVNCLVDSIR